MAATGIELTNAASLSHLSQGQARLGKNNTHAMPGWCCRALEQVNTRAEIPLHAHNRQQEVPALEAWGHAVLETLGPHPAAPALPCPWDCEFLRGKAATPSPGRKTLIYRQYPDGMIKQQQQCIVQHVSSVCVP